MSKFKAGEHVFVKNGKGQWFPGEIINYNDFREPGMEYAIDLYDFGNDYVFAGEDEIELNPHKREGENE